MGLGFITMPMFFPLMAMDHGISGLAIGMVLSLPPLTTIVTVPLIKPWIDTVGIEFMVSIASFCYGVAYMIMGVAA